MLNFFHWDNYRNNIKEKNTFTNQIFSFIDYQSQQKYQMTYDIHWLFIWSNKLTLKADWIES